MFSRSSWLHLRFPFSYFLLPIYFFSVALSPNFNGSRLLWVFFIVHFLLYPASNGYNSYFDKDQESIGGLKNPPPVNKGLYFLSLLLDMLAILLAVIKINITFAVMLFLYGLVSKAYSHPAVRLKKYPLTGWITAGFFQGFFTLVMCFVGINDFGIENSFNSKIIFGGILASVMLWGNYPMTQVYQHKEDASRGDHTISLALGIKGTFYFVGGIFTLATLGFFFYFKIFFDLFYSYVFVIALAPVVVYFLFWFRAVYKDEKAADYTKTMWLNFISSTCLNAFFLYLFLSYTHILDALLGK